jgi:hypothetical protein
VAATSVGIVGGAALLDLCYEEDSQAEVDMNVVMTADGGLIETQATAEKGSAFARATQRADRSGRGGAEGDLRRAAGGARRRHAGILPAVVRRLVAQHGMLACFHRETNSLDLHYVNVHRRLLRRSGRKNLLL